MLLLLLLSLCVLLAVINLFIYGHGRILQVVLLVVGAGGGGAFYWYKKHGGRGGELVRHSCLFSLSLCLCVVGVGFVCCL